MCRPNMTGRKEPFTIPPDGRGLEANKHSLAFEQAEMKYDSTGMFHWCPARPIEECILVEYTGFVKLYH